MELVMRVSLMPTDASWPLPRLGRLSAKWIISLYGVIRADLPPGGRLRERLPPRLSRKANSRSAEHLLEILDQHRIRRV